MRRFFAGLLPLVCLLLTACAEPPTGELAPVDVYLPPETEVRGDAPAERTLTLDGETFTLAYRCTTSSPRWPFALDVYADESGALTAEYRSGEDRPAAVSRSGPTAGGEPLSEDAQRERAAAWLSACGVSVDGYAQCEAERFSDGSLLLSYYDVYEGYILRDGTDVLVDAHGRICFYQSLACGWRETLAARGQSPDTEEIRAAADAAIRERCGTDGTLERRELSVADDGTLLLFFTYALPSGGTDTVAFSLS